MKKTFDGRWKEIRWGVITSVVLHLAVVAFFVVKLPEQPPKPPEEEAVKVEMVPPPEETKPEEPKPQEKKAEEKKPEEKKPEEKPPELPKIEEKAEQKPPAPPPAPPPPPPPPPAPPPPPPPEAKAEEKPPEEKPAEPPKSEAQNDPTDKQGKGQSIPVLRPVFEFGDKDSGPRKSETGDASQEAGKPPVTPPDEPKPEDPKPVDAASGKPPVTDQPPANPVPDDVALPQVDMANINPEKNGPAAGAKEDAKTDFTPPKPAEKPKTDQTETAKAETPSDLKEAKTLFSQSDTGDAVARTAIGNMPRSRRASQLCSTELREQLIHGSPAYNPVIVPAYGLPQGTVLDVKRGAFRTREGWYDVQFRCEVDQGVTKIQSFAVSVGDAIPQSQWRSRGFPEF